MGPTVLEAASAWLLAAEPASEEALLRGAVAPASGPPTEMPTREPSTSERQQVEAEGQPPEAEDAADAVDHELYEEKLIRTIQRSHSLLEPIDWQLPCPAGSAQE